VVHVYHHYGVGLLRGLPGQAGNKLVKGIPVSYAGKGIYLEVGSDDKKIAVEQGGAQAGPDQGSGIQYDVYGRACAGKDDKETDKVDVNFIELFGGGNEFIDKKDYRKITDDEPEGIQFFPD
jgi:hypothetical protein